MTFTISVAGQTYHLAADADVTDLRDRLVTAVRDGGDLVAIPSAGERQVSVLVSPGLPVFFEERPESAASRKAEADSAPQDGSRDVFSVMEWDSF
jgi:hypothetical protein